MGNSGGILADGFYTEVFSAQRRGEIMKVQRYTIQQDKGEYCLKACEDGCLVDYFAYADMAERARAAEARLHVYSSRAKAPQANGEVKP